MNRTYTIHLTDVAEGVITYYHGSLEKGREHFDTLNAALQTIQRLEDNGYEPADGGVYAIQVMITDTERYASTRTMGGDNEQETV